LPLGEACLEDFDGKSGNGRVRQRQRVEHAGIASRLVDPLPEFVAKSHAVVRPDRLRKTEGGAWHVANGAHRACVFRLETLAALGLEDIGQVIGPGHGLPRVELEAVDRGPGRFVGTLRNIAQKHCIVVPRSGVVRVQFDRTPIGFLGAGFFRVAQQVALRIVGFGQVRIERERAVDRRLRASHQRSLACRIGVVQPREQQRCGKMGVRPREIRV
jgi:hypothetical protein